MDSMTFQHYQRIMCIPIVRKITCPRLYGAKLHICPTHKAQISFKSLCSIDYWEEKKPSFLTIQNRVTKLSLARKMDVGWACCEHGFLRRRRTHVNIHATSRNQSSNSRNKFNSNFVGLVNYLYCFIVYIHS